MVTGKELVALALKHLGEKYVNVQVPKNDAGWKGPWDCAEFASWVVFQKLGTLYGCTDNNDHPADADAYSGAWVRDVEQGVLSQSTREAAHNTPGIILIRRPPGKGKMGHVAISDGNGRTVEAASSAKGVTQGKIEGRLWHFYATIPGVTYSVNATAPAFVAKPSATHIAATGDGTSKALIKSVQRALKEYGFDPGPTDGIYGPRTIANVLAFQRWSGLNEDGIVGPATAKKLKIEWP